MWDRGPVDTHWLGPSGTSTRAPQYMSWLWEGWGLGPGTRGRYKEHCARALESSLTPNTGEDGWPLIPATFGLTCAGEEGPGQVLWVVEPREHAWGGGPAEKVQLCANLQLVGIQLHLQGNRVCTKAVCKGLDNAQGKASTDNLD